MGGNVPDDGGERARTQLFGILTQARLWQAISAAASLRIPDQLRNGPRTTSDIAAEIGAHEPTLYRLLRALAAAGILHEAEPRTFALTDLGRPLLSDVDGSMRDWATSMGRPYVHMAWSHLVDSVRSGENTFAALNGEDVWSWRAHEPAERALFDGAMASLSAGLGQALVAAYDLTSMKELVDVAGGTGTLLASVLAAQPQLHGILFDQPDVVDSPGTTAVLEAAGVADRCERLGGSFFEAVPEGADGYLLKAILHDWEDADAVRILRTIRAAARARSRILVLEVVIGPPNEDLAGKISDLTMLVMPGGRERTEPEWRDLFDSGGFRLEQIRRLTPRWSLLVGIPKGSQPTARSPEQ
jgi:hypothetical protein